MKKPLVIIGIILAVIIVLGILKDPFVKSAVTVVTSKVVGAPVKIDKFSIGVFKQAVVIKNFRIYNPKGFPEGILIDISEISVEYDLGALFGGKLHLKEMVFDLKEVGLVKNKDGQLNVDALKVAQKEEGPSEGAEKQQKPSKAMLMQIDVCKLNIGKVVMKDYSAGDKPTVQVYEVGVKDKVYKNITSAQQLATLVLTESMKGAGIKGAGIYGAASILGVAFLPAGVAGVLAGKDSSQVEFSVDFDTVFKTSLEVMQQMGKVKKEDKGNGVIKGKVSGADVTLKLEKQDNGNMQVTISARQFMLPKPEIAGGILHQISEKLK